jgi:hypothetical protein
MNKLQLGAHNKIIWGDHTKPQTWRYLPLFIFLLELQK